MVTIQFGGKKAVHSALPQDLDLHQTLARPVRGVQGRGLEGVCQISLVASCPVKCNDKRGGLVIWALGASAL